MYVNPCKNKTYIYLLPVVGMTIGAKKDQLINLVGVFLKNSDYPDLTEEDQVLHILFKKSRYLTSHEQLLSTICEKYSPDTQSTMYLFKVPSEYKREYRAFVQNKYSEFSDNYKKTIIKFHNYRDSINPSGSLDGDHIINVMYRKESAYIKQEEVINEGLPVSEWTRIPRNQEICSRWDSTEESILRESYTEDLKIKQEINK